METSAICLFLVCLIFLLCEQINASSSVVNNGTTTETTALLSSGQVKLSHSPLFIGPSITTNHSSNKQMTLQTSHNAASPVGNIGTTTEMTSLLSLDQVKSSHSPLFIALSLSTKHSSRKQMTSQLSQYSASSVVKPPPSLLSIDQPVTTRHSSNKPVTSHMSPSMLASGQSGSISSVLDKSKLITNTVPQQKTSSLTMKTPNPSTTSVTTVISKTSAESKSSVSIQANDYNSTSILSSPATQAVDNITTNAIPSSSMFKVITSGLTSLPNPTLNSSSSKGNGMHGPSKQHSSTLTAAVSIVSSPHIACRTFVPSPFSVLKTTSLTPAYSTSNRIKVNQTNTTNSVGNHSSSTVKVTLSISSVVFKHSSSAKPLLNTSSISTMTNTNTSLPSSVNATPSSRVELHITSTPSSLKNLSHVMNSAMSSIPTQSPAVFASSVISTYNQSSTAKTGRSCYNNNTLLTCVTLQPSAPMQFTTTTSRVIMSKSLSNSVNSTFSLIVPPTTKKGSKEETHKPLIIGLAVGLSVGMILIIIIVVYYRRKRSSYQYNVFYDEQNIVMHPFDYSK